MAAMRSRGLSAERVAGARMRLGARGGLEAGAVARDLGGCPRWRAARPEQAAPAGQSCDTPDAREGVHFRWSDDECHRALSRSGPAPEGEGRLARSVFGTGPRSGGRGGVGVPLPFHSCAPRPATRAGTGDSARAQPPRHDSVDRARSPVLRRNVAGSSTTAVPTRSERLAPSFSLAWKTVRR